MDTLETLILNYIEFCKCQKRLDEKTLKAYRIDLKQFKEFIPANAVLQIIPCNIEAKKLIGQNTPIAQTSFMQWEISLYRAKLHCCYLLLNNIVPPIKPIHTT